MVKNIVPTPKKAEIFDGIIKVPFSIECEHSTWDAYTKTSLTFLSQKARE